MRFKFDFTIYHRLKGCFVKRFDPWTLRNNPAPEMDTTDVKNEARNFS